MNPPRLLKPLAALVLMCGLAGACGGGERPDAAPGVTIEPLGSSTPRVLRPIGGKPAAPPAPVTPADEAAPTETPEPAIGETAVPVGGASPASEPTATATARASDGSVAPTEGRWIDVDVTTYVVRLMDGSDVEREIAPVAVGTDIDTGEYASTQTGLFHVYNKIEELAYDPPYDTYISHWVGFDVDKANGFHSFLKDEVGAIVDPATGRISNGCIRTGDAAAIFAYAEIGMPVYVHW